MIDKKEILFTFKKSYHIAHNEKYFCCCGGSANLYDKKTGEHVSRFSDMVQPSFAKFTTDSRLIVKTTRGDYYIYNLISHSLMKKIKRPKGVLGSTTEFFITPDNRYVIDLAHVFPTASLFLLDIEREKYTMHSLGATTRHGQLCADNGRWTLITSLPPVPPNNRSEIYSVDYRDGGLQLQKRASVSLNGQIARDCRFDKIIRVEDNVLNIYHIPTQRSKQLFNIGEDTGLIYDIKWSANGKYVAVVESFLVRIFDVEKQECIQTYEIDHGCFAEFYDHDTKLLIGTWGKGYCISLTV